MRKPAFLPTFFIALGVAFVIALMIRLRTSGAAMIEGERRIESHPTRSTADPSPPIEPVVLRDAPAVAAARKQSRAEEWTRPSSEAGAVRSELPPVAQERNPSLLTPFVNPIVGPSGAAAGSAPPKSGVAERSAAAAGRTPVAERSAVPAERSASTSTGAEPASGRENKDPDSDTTPPQLLTIEFNPATVHDGEETVLAVMASDDLSGIRTIAGNIASPGGALQGFAVDREGDSTRYVARIAVPKNGAEGLWHVNFLSLTDAANNTRTLSWRQGAIPQTASFRVISSRPDTAAPVIKSVRLDRLSAKSGERTILFVEAEDDQSGVNLVSGVFVSPSRFARIPVGCRPQKDGPWQCDVTAPAGADCGDWQLEQLQVQDKANNLTVVRSDNPLIAQIRLNLSSDTCDARPPIVQSVTLDSVLLTAPGMLRLTILATDDASGIANVSGHFVFAGPLPAGNQPPRLYFSCRPTSDAQSWSGSAIIPEKAARGIWKLGSLQLVDKAGNLKIYVDPDPVVAGAMFRIQ